MEQSLSAEEFAKLPRTGTVDPKTIRFSQNSMKRTFDNGGDVGQLAADLRGRKIDPASISPIRIVNKEGKIFTLDNRRLQAFQEAGIPIRYKKLDAIPKKELFKLTTRNEGASIKTRGQ